MNSFRRFIQTGFYWQSILFFVFILPKAQTNVRKCKSAAISCKTKLHSVQFSVEVSIILQHFVALRLKNEINPTILLPSKLSSIQKNKTSSEREKCKLSCKFAQKFFPDEYMDWNRLHILSYTFQRLWKILSFFFLKVRRR